MKIFLSAVSGQFRECREVLASDLRAMGAVVDEQTDFQQHSTTLLKKLEEKVAACDRVIALVGDAHGFEPPVGSLPEGTPRRSFTQWEYHFALGERLDGSKAPRKPIYLYFASPEYLKAHPVAQDDDQANLQKDFLAFIRQSGEDYNKFHSLDGLCRLALRDGFQVRDPDRKPNNLPTASIGSLFKGRAGFLEQLRQRLTGPNQNGKATAIVARQAIHGLGGVGKTRAAVEYAWDHQDDYSALLFISAPSRTLLESNLANLCGLLAIDAGGPTVEAQMAAVLAWLDDHPGWLLIVDNVDSDEAARAVEALLARLKAGHVLITSRIGDWSNQVEALELHLLAEADAVAFLLDKTEKGRRKQADDPAQATAIAGELDGLALALEQAGAYIARLHFSFAEYRQRWEQNRVDVLQ